MARGNGSTLDDWIEQSWPDGAPPWTRDAFADLYREEQRQAAAEKRQTLEAQKIARLERENANLHKRLARLERLVGPGGKTLVNTIAKGFGPAVRQRLEELHGLMEPRIADLESRPSGLQYEGVWSAEREYPAGSLVTHSGAGYVAIAVATKGEKPGTGGNWRLAVKSDETKLRRMIKEELRRQPVAR